MRLSNILLFSCCLFMFPGYSEAQSYADTYVVNPIVQHNEYLKKNPDLQLPVTFKNSQSKLPEPVWPARKDVLLCYWKAWEIAFSNLHQVTKENGFISPYIDAAFNQHIFMWDTSFMVLFGRYGHNAFNFQSSLDNFYHRQHRDGYICREIAESNGDEIFERFDPSSTGPNIMAWSEWEYFLNFNDIQRLKAVFDPLLAYYQWYRTYRSWPDGTYFSTGWGCGMDNLPRVPAGFSPEFSPAFMSWIDITLQQIFTGKILLAMANQLNRKNEVKDIETEIKRLTGYVQQQMWDEKTSFFYDRYRNGSLSTVKSIAAYWGLLAEVVPEGKLDKFVEHLENPNEFARLHRVPTLSADNVDFKADGGYWRGGVWAPTSYMVLRGLTKYKQDSLAYVIALNHLENVVKVFSQTGTIWENYAPDKVQGNGQKEMVGWTGLVPISVLFEYVFGIRPNVPENMITWDIRLLDEFGVKKYPFAAQGLINFWCAKRKKETDRPKIKVQSSVPFTLKVLWKGGSEIIAVHAE
ncbi:trehalase family glycosidase [Pedobacter sp. L105]|uniref:MGH1-like glycoside hydrolase domain-containing protein n=1 Tax=Pedobacter sp. L105 TaxID=1641871 RepID=UPI00131E8A45|nr:trehalase family glycosidase [Pedobacter sp. L105]